MSEKLKNWNKYKCWFDVKDEKKRDYFGNVYIVEFGNNIKIGCSEQINKRLQQLDSIATNYCQVNIGQVLVSVSCTNFKQIEQQLHKEFNNYRIGKGELFNVSLVFVEAVLSNLVDIDFKNECAEQTVKSINMNEALKTIIMKESLRQIKREREYYFNEFTETISPLLDKLKNITNSNNELISKYILVVKTKLDASTGITAKQYCEGKGVILSSFQLKDLENIASLLYYKDKQKVPLQIGATNPEYIYFGDDVYYLELAFYNITTFELDTLKDELDDFKIEVQ